MAGINYAQNFESQIQQKYAKELTSADMEMNKSFKFLNAKTVNIPTLVLSGYKDHTRDGVKNKGTVSNTYEPKALTHDRNISFYVDEMDIDETNLVLSAANITNTFLTEQAIPELDAYRYSKLYADFVAKGGTADTTVLTTANILSVFDNAMKTMDDNSVPADGRQLKVIPAVGMLLKNAAGIQRTADVKSADGVVNRSVYYLDGVKVTMVPPDRMKTAYVFTEGFAPASTAKQINFILYHPLSMVAPTKVADVYLWNKGDTPESAYGILYQNRSYYDLFLIEAKKAGVFFNTVA